VRSSGTERFPIRVILMRFEPISSTFETRYFNISTTVSSALLKLISN
jgi:hypothetical protein